MEAIFFVGIVVLVLIFFVRKMMQSKDEKIIAQLNQERKLAYEMAWKTFAPNEKNRNIEKFEYNMNVDPPMLAKCYNMEYFELTNAVTNYYDVYKFINGKWVFCKKKNLTNKVWKSMGNLDVCKEFNCNLCSSYLYFTENIRNLRFR